MSHTECASATNCNCTKRVITALNDFQSLDVTNNEDDNHKLVLLCEKQYKSILDDFIHLIQNHNNDSDFNQIWKLAITQHDFVKCDINKCASKERYYRDRRNNKQHKMEDENVIFYRDLLDQIHCFIFHLYDSGLRIKKKDITAKMDNINNNSWFDETFSTICDEVKAKKKEMRYQSNKFSITDRGQNESQDTYMDGLYAFSAQTGTISESEIKRIYKLFMDDEYDSEAIKADVDINDKTSQSNIAMYDAKLYDLVCAYIHYHKLHQHTFSIGYRFYYWQYYENYTETLKHYRLSKNNANAHGGYKIHELYIPKKYTDIKQEILHNKTFTLNYNELQISITKANKYINTHKAKKLIASPYDEKELDRDRHLHYNIPKGTKISYNHILSIIVYCDWSELCCKFSGTFRKKKLYELLSSIKQRNQEYANWSRLLRETVECFGDNALGTPTTNGKWIKQLKGPFFCGMDFVMMLPEYDIRLCGPTSTSKHIEIATRFAGPNGIIIELNNSIGGFFVNQLAAFGCSWLSHYASEEEWLFVGGQYSIKVETIRLKTTRENFKDFFGVLYHFDAMINGKKVKRKMKKFEKKMLRNLIAHKLNVNRFQNDYPKYINDTFEAYANHKTQIIIDLPVIKRYFQELLNFVIFPSNAFKPMLLHLFKNTNKMMIYTADSRTSQMLQGRVLVKQYSSQIKLVEILRSLVSIPMNHGPLELTISADVDNKSKFGRYHGRFGLSPVSRTPNQATCWLKKEMQSNIPSEFEKNGFDITMKSTKRKVLAIINKNVKQYFYNVEQKHEQMEEIIFPLTTVQKAFLSEESQLELLLADVFPDTITVNGYMLTLKQRRSLSSGKYFRPTIRIMEMFLGTLMSINEIQSVKCNIFYDIVLLKFNDQKFFENMISTTEKGVIFIQHEMIKKNKEMIRNNKEMRWNLLEMEQRKEIRQSQIYLVIKGGTLYSRALNSQIDRFLLSVTNIVNVEIGKTTNVLVHHELNDIPASSCLGITAKTETLHFSSPTQDVVGVQTFATYLKGLWKHFMTR